MKPNTQKSPQSAVPTARINEVIAGVIPKGKDYTVRIDDSGVGKLKIIRVVTPAWRSLRPADRINKVLDAANTQLQAGERKNILRWSVLTPDEYDRLVAEGVIKREEKRVTTSRLKSGRASLGKTRAENLQRGKVRAKG